MMAATFGPEDSDWKLYTHLVSETSNLGYYHDALTTQREISISPPYIVPAQNKSSADTIRSTFGAPIREAASATWEPWATGNETTKVTGTVWAYPSGLEILFVDGRAAYVKTPRPDRRVLFGS